ncbi:MAG: lipid-A-disaccharide synthase [Cyanobacteria bacterium P01_D01_bin.115]
MAQQEAAAADQALHIFISTGEVSGDLQGSYLIQALHRQAQTLGLSLRVSGLGGPRMVAAGADLVGDTTPIGSVGILEALPYLLPNWKIQQRVQKFFRQEAIDLTIFLDYMGPNLGLGAFLLDRFPDLPTAYYIAPQQWVWAFSEKDTEQVVRIADQMVAVFPQEAEFYRDYGANVSYFGHPLVDKLAQSPSRLAARQNLGLSETVPVITLLPASRQQEVTYVLPLLLAVAEKIQATQPDVEFLVPISMGKLRPAIETAIARSGVKARLIEGDSLPAIAAADLVLNKSGTANLEVALLNVPQVVVYRLNPITARIGYYLLRLRIEYVSPVNLFLNQAIVPEFIQWEATVEDVTATALKLLTDNAARQTMLDSYAELRAAMGEPGVCDRVAAHLLAFALKQKHKRLGAANPRLAD